MSMEFRHLNFTYLKRFNDRCKYRRLLMAISGATILSLSAIASDPANAVQLRFGFSGVITDVNNQGLFDQSFIPGTPITGSYTFDSESTTQFQWSNLYSQRQGSFHITVGDRQFSHSDFFVYVSNDFLNKDSYLVSTNNFLCVPEDDSCFDPTPHMSLWLEDPTASVLSSKQPPLDAAQLMQFSTKAFRFSQFKDRSNLWGAFEGRIDAIEVTPVEAVPEPSAIAGLMLAAGGVIASRQRKAARA
ncbi:PEP-CTERM sorting domain-containing protein [Leptothermofonsia sichuanensis E412]|uniref:PEP-CTERM sorting domain-containing protein n=1 Tax=Leptothermofonsia sichuanensis TaxID=2917832 RepID=UPI001CA7828C|nr:PEP-CTERM sorting domain-containing protein [Leptothermofonsia sichuanensis]QZZ21617.1 PEP-CTERM sorting domain-containing protein [Leptothermofonsia sichuanensis E412]